MKTLCSHCEFSKWDGQTLTCDKWLDAQMWKEYCYGYRCAPIDKIDGTRSRAGNCFICGRPIYTRGRNVPLYCYEHRAYVEEDNKLIETAPKELLFGLIAGIFLRAKDDYIYNTDGAGKDAEIFFKSEWAQELSAEGFNVESLLEILDKERADEFE